MASPAPATISLIPHIKATKSAHTAGALAGLCMAEATLLKK
jgi:hypothetical protein